MLAKVRTKDLSDLSCIVIEKRESGVTVILGRDTGMKIKQ